MHNNLLLALQSGTGAPDLVDIQIDRTSNYMGDNDITTTKACHIDPR